MTAVLLALQLLLSRPDPGTVIGQPAVAPRPHPLGDPDAVNRRIGDERSYYVMWWHNYS